jgi:hypothetical protein
MYGEGKTDQEIADTLGEPVTPESVERKRKYLNLVKARPEPPLKKEVHEPFNPAARFGSEDEKQTPEALAMERAAAAFYGTLDEDHCEWPHGEPCLQDRAPGHPYCEEHQKESLRPAPNVRTGKPKRTYRHPSEDVFH